MTQKTNSEIYNEMKGIEQRLDDHIKIYEANGQAVRDNNKLITDLTADLTPMIEFMHSANYGKNFLIGTAKIFGAIGVIVGSTLAVIKGIK